MNDVDLEKRLWSRRLVFLIVLVGGVFICVYVLYSQKLDLHQKTNCPIEKLAHHTILLIDKTDVLQRDQINLIRKKLLDISRDLFPGERLSIYTIDDVDFYGKHPIFSKCSPGSGKHFSELTSNPKIGEIKFVVKFARPVEQLIGHLTRQESHEQSPILEDIAELPYKAHFGKEVKSRNIIIISDMMQNTTGINIYHHTIEQLMISTENFTLEHMKNINISAFVIPRPKHKNRQREILENYWPRVFQFNNNFQFMFLN